MIKSPARDTAQQIETLQNLSGGKTLIALLQDERLRLLESSVHAGDDRVCRQLQGGAIVLGDLLAILTNRTP